MRSSRLSTGIATPHIEQSCPFKNTEIITHVDIIHKGYIVLRTRGDYYLDVELNKTHTIGPKAYPWAKNEGPPNS